MGKNVVLGVTGSIAAHRAADLSSLLTKQGCEVHVVMTADALRFITAVPFKTLSRHPVITDLYDDDQGWQPAHIKLADEADLLLIAPATANTIAKLALGIADDALSCVALALNPQAKILIAPAMNGKMWLHPATQQNARRRVHRPGGRPALLRLRRSRPVMAGRESGRASPGLASLAPVQKACYAPHRPAPPSPSFSSWFTAPKPSGGTSLS